MGQNKRSVAFIRPQISYNGGAVHESKNHIIMHRVQAA